MAKALMDSGETEFELTKLAVIDQVRIHETMMSIALQRTTVSAEYLTALAEAFFNSCKIAQLGFDQLYRIYMAKNVLNKFRQDHGYKEGTYIKEWSGQEDNVVMFEIIALMPSFSGDELYIRLKEAYSALR
ncbi:MAG: dUTP diphosphatase [Gammaproteobacteria bacterium]|nr:dUTP diphosphatase [Gammaproteobacteria bacterium]